MKIIETLLGRVDRQKKTSPILLNRSPMIISGLVGLLLFLNACASSVAPTAPDLADQLIAQHVPLVTWDVGAGDRVPDAGASDEEYLLFWLGQRDGDSPHGIGLPPVVGQRLLKTAVAQPHYIPALLDSFPATAATYDTLKVLYDQYTRQPEADPTWKESVHDWLMTHSSYFRDDLVAAARATKHNPKYYYIEDTALLALIKLDWSAAELVLNELRHAGDVHVAAIALALCYEHAQTVSDQPTVKMLRERLKILAGDHKTPGSVRDRLFTALLASDWPGQDEWFLALFSDPTLEHLSEDHHGFLNPLAEWVQRRHVTAIPAVTKLLGDKNLVIRNNAVAALFESRRIEALRPLLPALTEPKNWPERLATKLTRRLQVVELPESVPGLLVVLREGDPYARNAAVLALAHQGAKEAPAALRQWFPTVTDYQQRREFVAAMLQCHVLRDVEIVAAIEAYATDEAARSAATQTADPEVEKAEAVVLGELLTRSDSEREERMHRLAEQLEALRGSDAADPRVREFRQQLMAEYKAHQARIPDMAERPEIVAALVRRARSLNNTNPQVAEAFWQIIAHWPSPAVEAEWGRRLREEPLDEALVTLATQNAPTLRSKIAADLRAVAQQGGQRGAVAAAVLADAPTIARILEGDDHAAMRMLLACSRLANTPLPIAQVGRFLQSRDQQLALATEAYLLFQDGPEARRLVAKHYAPEYLILGGGEKYPPFPTQEAAATQSQGAIEKPSLAKLREEMLGKDAPEEIYAFLSGGGFGDNGQCVIRVRRGSAELEFVSTATHRRQLTPAEWKDFSEFIQQHHVDDLPPLETMVFDGVWYDYVHLSRTGGRRIYINNPGSSGSAGSVYQRLELRFLRLTETLQPQ